MENAAKALLIAGGILLALMTLSLVVYMLTATDRMRQAQAEKKEVEDLAAFNMEYESYNKSRMYGLDVITVVNKANNNNVNSDFKITIEVYNKEGVAIEIEYTSEFKNKIFQCRKNEVKYNTKTGRIEKMVFDEI